MKAAILYIGTIVAILVIAIWWQIYQFRDCKKVGHATLYCVMHVGS